MRQDTEPVPAAVQRWADQLRARRAARLADPNTPPWKRKLLEARPPPDWELEGPMPTQTPTRARKRRLDFVKQVKRAMAAGLHVRSASLTADGVVVTFGEAGSPAPADGTVMETADLLRKLI
jgi:hypothetical protein